MKDRQLVTFWLLKKEHEQFLAACEREGKKMTDVLREAVLLMVEPGQGRDG